MKLYGLQKMTLLDFPGKVACTVFTGGCNFRCPFCHNASLVLNPGECEPLETDDILAYLKKRQGILDGVAVTGGEPLMHPETKDLICEIKSLGYAVKLDTNGSYPNRLAEILEMGKVDYVAMDIKNSPEKYPMTVGVPDLDITPIEESIGLLMKSKTKYEFRTTVVRECHEAEDFVKIGEWIRNAEAYYIQSFKDSGDILTDGCSAYEKEDLEKFLEIMKKYIPGAELREL